jgi:hypothetical protein
LKHVETTKSWDLYHIPQTGAGFLNPPTQVPPSRRAASPNSTFLGRVKWLFFSIGSLGNAFVGYETELKS